MTTITPVAIPCSEPIPGGVRRGLKIEVQGTLLQSAKDGFRVNLSQGPEADPITTLHVNPRFRADGYVLVLNHKQNGKWGKEERVQGQHFQKGKPFNLKIKVKPDLFKIKVDGRCVATFNHRFPIETAQYIRINGEVSVDFIKFTGRRGGDETRSAEFDNPQVAQSAEFNKPGPKPVEFIKPVAVPYSGIVPGGVRRGLKIEIQGTLLQTATDGFRVNLCQGPKKEPITTLHVNPQFRADGYVLVLNHMQNSTWGKEERVQGQHFQKGKPFNLKIKVKPDLFKIKVDGRRVAMFKHRLPIETAQYIFIDGEVSVDFIKFTGRRRGDGTQSAELDNPQVAQSAEFSSQVHQ